MNIPIVLYNLNDIKEAYISDTHPTSFTFTHGLFTCELTFVPMKMYNDVHLTEETGTVWWVGRIVAKHDTIKTEMTLSFNMKRNAIDSVYKLASDEFNDYMHSQSLKNLKWYNRISWKTSIVILLIVLASVHYFIN